MQHLQKTGGWGLRPPPFDILTPIPANVSNVFPIYPLCSHTPAALTDSTALEHLFSNQPVTHSFRRDGGYPLPSSLSFPAPSLDRPQSRVTSHGPCLPLSTTVQSTTPSLMYIVRVASSRLLVRGIARSFCVGGRHEQNFEDCRHRRRGAGRPCSRRAVFDPCESVPPHH